MTQTVVDSATLDQWLADDAELGVLDLRSEEQFGRWGEPLAAANVPAARLIARVGDYVPRRTVRLVLVDAGDGVAQLAAADLAALGYLNVHVLDGGFPAWLASGFTRAFSVTGTRYSQTIEADFHTPSITPAELNRLYSEQADVVVLDSRTAEEFNRDHVPRAVSAPGAELVHRFADLVPSPSTFVVVSCAGLPRAILGAQTLIDAGVPNKVAYLVDGTSGWVRAGFELERNAARPLGPVSETASAFAHEHIRHFGDGGGSIPHADTQQLTQWRAEADRTTYLLDVRTPEEFAHNHLPGSISTPGGQLILGTHRFLGVRGARLVLIDDDGARAATTAHWLRRRGWEVWIHHIDAAAATASSALPVHARAPRATAIKELWYTRCPVPTVSGVAQHFGWLQDEFARRGIALRSIRASQDRAVRDSHFTHSHPGMFREGGNVPPIWARANGRNTAVVGITWVDEEQVILVRPDDNIRDLGDLKGRRLGLPRHATGIVDIGRAQDLRGLLTALKLGGLSRDEVKFVDIAGPDYDLRERADPRRRPAADALLTGDVDAIYAKGAVSAALIAEHGLRPIVDINASPDPLVRVNAGTPRPITVDRSLALEQPEIVARYLAVLLRTAQWAAQHPAEVIEAVAAETGARASDVRRGFGSELHRRLEPALSEQYLSGLETQKAFLLDEKFLSADFDFEHWIVREPLQLAHGLVHEIELPQAA